MKPTLRKTGKQLPISRLGGSIILVGISLLIVLILVIFASDSDPDESGSQLPVMTTDPQIILNLTALPQATPLSGEEAGVWDNFLAMVDACNSYSPERRFQMEQHIEWLLDPSDMPPNIIFAMGGDPPERLIFGMATYTSIQWRLDDRPPDSCLIPIGLTLNDMLIALGTEPFDTYN